MYSERYGHSCAQTGMAKPRVRTGTGYAICYEWSPQRDGLTGVDVCVCVLTGLGGSSTAGVLVSGALLGNHHRHGLLQQVQQQLLEVMNACTLDSALF